MIKKFMAKNFPKDDFKTYKKGRIKQTMFIPIYFGIMNIIFYIIYFWGYGAGYFVVVRNKTAIINEDLITNTQYGFVAINNIWEQLFFGTNIFMHGANIFSDSFADAISTSITCFLISRFLQACYKYTPFSIEAVSCLRKLSHYAAFIFIGKMLFGVIIAIIFNKSHVNEGVLNYVGFSFWAFVSSISAFLLNVFMYGNQIKTDNDLAI